jgi:hypothetical protein
MNYDDALRKIRLLRQVRPENGACEAEAENAANLVQSLMDRFAVLPDQTAQPRPPVFRMSWVYWENLANEYGLIFKHFGKRGSARIGGDRQVLIRLETGEWRVERSVLGKEETVASGQGVEALRNYLSRNTSRIYSLANNAPQHYRPR